MTEGSSTKPRQFVQCFGKKKTSVALAVVEPGTGYIKVNGKPLHLVEPAPLRMKLYEPLLILGGDRFSDLNIRIKVRGGGQTSQVYAIRQAICKGLVAYYQKYVDEFTKREIKDILLQFDRSLLVADPRRTEPKKYGGGGARSRYQKSYR